MTVIRSVMLFEANTKILMTVFGARQREVEEADPEDVLSAVKKSIS